MKSAVLVHGGFWRDRYDASLMDALAADLEARGWAVLNLEYRRLGSGGGWPATFDDVAAGISSLRGDTGVHLHMRHGYTWAAPDPLVAIGHSAGGHLALWAAAEGLVTHAAGQAAVSDLREAARLGLSNGAARELLGGRDELYPLASPRERLPLGVPQLLVHGEADEIVPVAMSRDYAAAAPAEIDLVTLPGVGHFEHLDPSSSAWRSVLEWLP